ncbi:hypothetical protein ON010_g1337 [Phytophthora cinnamomi]|nr:hypothetical protein ON010_g1337 [Phytophthora cinnamomi]
MIYMKGNFKCTYIRLALLVVDEAHGQRSEHAKDQQDGHEHAHVLPDAPVLDPEDLVHVQLHWDVAHTRRRVLQESAAQRVARQVERAAPGRAGASKRNLVELRVGAVAEHDGHQHGEAVAVRADVVDPLVPRRDLQRRRVEAREHEPERVDQDAEDGRELHGRRRKHHAQVHEAEDEPQQQRDAEAGQVVRRRAQAHVPAHAGLRHVLGRLPRGGGHELRALRAQAHRLQRGLPELHAVHGRGAAVHEPAQEGVRQRQRARAVRAQEGHARAVQDVPALPAGPAAVLRPPQGAHGGARRHGRVVRGQRHLRAGQQEAQELPGPGAAVLPPAHHVLQQLDAHQGGQVVGQPRARGAAPRAQAAGPARDRDPEHPGQVAALRVHQHRHHGAAVHQEERRVAAAQRGGSQPALPGSCWSRQLDEVAPVRGHGAPGADCRVSCCGRHHDPDASAGAAVWNGKPGQRGPYYPRADAPDAECRRCLPPRAHHAHLACVFGQQLARVPGNTAATVDASLSSLAPSSGSMLGSSSSSNHKMKVTDDEPAKRSHGVEVARQLVDIAVRVKSVRSVMVDNMIELLMEKEALSGPGAGTLQEVYYAAAWITGEYVMEFLDDVDDDDEEEEDEDDDRETEEEKLQRLEDLSDEMLQPRTTTLPGHVQTVFIQALLKILTAMAERADDATVERIATVIMERLPAFVQSEYIEVQERAVCLQQLLLALSMGLGALTAQERTERAFDGSASLDPAKRLDVLNSYFAERLAPVGVKAQRKVPLPGNLDLDEPLSKSEAKFLESGGDVSAFSSEDDLEVSFVSQGHAGIGGGYSGIGDASPERKPGSKHHRHRRHDGSSSSESESESESENSADEKERKEREYAREQERLRKDPFYLSAGGQASNDAGSNAGFADMMGALGSGTNGKKKKASKKSKSRDILEDELMPEGARSSDEDRRRTRKKRGSIGEDETDLAAVDLSIPLGENEKVPTEQWFHRQTPAAKPAEDDKKSKKKSSKHKKSPRGEDDGKKKKKKESSSKSSKPKKSSRKQEDLLIGGFSDEEQEPVEAQESRHKHRSSSSKKSKKSSSSKNGGDAEKSKKKRKDKEHKSSKRQEAPPAEPLLLF